MVPPLLPPPPPLCLCQEKEPKRQLSGREERMGRFIVSPVLTEGAKGRKGGRKVLSSRTEKGLHTLSLSHLSLSL